MMVSRSALSIRPQRAISGKVRPQPRHMLVLGSIMQMATQGVSFLFSLIPHQMHILRHTASVIP